MSVITGLILYGEVNSSANEAHDNDSILQYPTWVLGGGVFQAKKRNMGRCQAGQESEGGS